MKEVETLRQIIDELYKSNDMWRYSTDEIAEIIYRRFRQEISEVNKLEIRNAEEIVRYGHSVRPNMLRTDYFKTKWISVDSLLERINNARDNGNLEGEKGFSASLFLSELIKELEQTKRE